MIAMMKGRKRKRYGTDKRMIQGSQFKMAQIPQPANAKLLKERRDDHRGRDCNELKWIMHFDTTKSAGGCTEQIPLAVNHPEADVIGHRQQAIQHHPCFDRL